MEMVLRMEDVVDMDDEHFYCPLPEQSRHAP